MRYPLFKSISLSIFLLFSFTCQLAQANVTAAYQAYQQKNYADAFQYFQQSAHLGVIDAQLNLANFYNEGIGCKTDPLMSYVYIALADDHGQDKLKALLTSIFTNFNTEQQTKAQNLWQKYQAKYGYQALINQIAPKLLDKKLKFRKALRQSGGSSVQRSRYLRRRSGLGSAIIDYDIGFDGKVRDVEINKNYYMDASTIEKIIDATAQTPYKPARLYKSKNDLGEKIKSYNHQMVWAQREITLYSLKHEMPKFYKKIKALQKSAEQGQVYAQYDLAMLYLVFPSLDVNTLHYVEYIKKAAQAALPEAELEYAKLLLQGKYVSRDFEQAISYIYHAAQSGYARAQYKLARHFLSGRVVDKDEHKALFWLEKAIEQDELYAKFWLARLYLVSHDETLRNPEQAKTLLESVAKQQKDNPNWYYFMAQAEFQLTNTEASKDFLTEAIDKAADLSWDMDLFNKLSAKI